jgi:dTDP-4-amino-4,6-dideoxygalactose transaminase
MKKKVWLSSPHMGGEEIRFIQEAFDTNWIAPIGPHVEAFEKELSTYNNIDHCAVLSSGTAAIHLALIILGVKQDDEVICSSFTFSGSCNPIAYQGATPVFVDSERQTWNMDPELLRDAIKDRISKTRRKPKAIILVHLYGMPSRINEVLQVASEFEIPVIEDAAEAIGSTYHNKLAGTFGDIGIYSFNGNKIITTSGGGAMVSKNEGWIKRARFLSTQARDPAPHYQHSAIGYNYRMSNVCAAIGRGQLKVLDERVQRRREIFNVYKKHLSTIADFQWQAELPGMKSNRWLTTIVLKDKVVTTEKIRLALEAENIESRPLWKPMHLQPVFKDCPAYVNGVSEDLFNHGLCLPSGSNMEQDDLDLTLGTIIRLFT